MTAKFKSCPSWIAPNSMYKAQVVTDADVTYVILFDRYSGAVHSGVEQGGRLVRIK